MHEGRVACRIASLKGHEWLMCVDVLVHRSGWGQLDSTHGHDVECAHVWLLPGARSSKIDVFFTAVHRRLSMHTWAKKHGLAMVQADLVKLFCAAECTCRAPSADVHYLVNRAFVAIVATHLNTVVSGRELQICFDRFLTSIAIFTASL